MRLARQKFIESFGTSGPVCIAVIHAVDIEQVLRNVSRAINANAHGVFLINHGNVAPSQLLQMYHEARSEFPKLWIGVNLLGLELMDALSAFPKDAAALWTDGSGIRLNGQACSPFDMHAKLFRSTWRGRNLNGNLWFGGVAFKYQEPVRDIEEFARCAALHMDVLTTSGSDTGKAPDPSKLREVVRGANGVPVVNASGTTLENAPELLSAGIDGVLVASGVSDSFKEINEERLGLMVELFRTSGS